MEILNRAVALAHPLLYSPLLSSPLQYRAERSTNVRRLFDELHFQEFLTAVDGQFFDEF